MRHPLQIACVVLSLAVPAFAAPPEFSRGPDGAASNGQTVADHAMRRSQRIAILPDRTTGMDWGLRYLRQAVDDLNRLSPDAVFTIGDMVQGYHRDPAEWTRQAQEYLTIVAPLTMPFYPVPGNHDVISGSRRPGDATFAELYRKTFGPLWYSVDLERLTVLVLFSDEGLGQRGPRPGDEQLRWLEGALTAAAARGKPIIVLLHRPLWRTPGDQWSARVQPLLERAKVRAVVAGHFHSMQHDEVVGGVEYHIVGTCGGSIDQHPFAGQLQHLTFVDVGEDGALRFFHQPVGVTLPADFVERADQDRVYKLLSDKEALRWLGAFPDPYLSQAPRVETKVLEFRNPLDVEVRISMRQVREAPQPWLVGRENWVSWTPVDIFNPHVTALGEPFNITLIESHPVAPGDVTQIPVTTRSTPMPTPARPVPIEVTVEMPDSKGRTVPVRFPLRLPLQRSMLLPATLDRAQPFPISVWEPSPYDRFEPDPECRMALTRGERGDELLVEVRSTDRVTSGHAQDDRQDSARFDDPASDAIRLVIESGGQKREWLVEPFNGNKVFGDGCMADPPTVLPDGGGWTQRIRVPWPGGRFQPGPGSTVNLGVADNDDTYHTQWRWLAPRSWPVLVQVGDPPLQEEVPKPQRPRRIRQTADPVPEAR